MLSPTIIQPQRYDKEPIKDLKWLSSFGLFALSDGYYFNLEKTIYVKSTNATGKLFIQVRSGDPRVLLE